MRKKLLIILFCFWGGIYFSKGNEWVSEDTTSIEIFSLDSIKYKEFKSQKSFDYYNQLPPETDSWLKALERKIYTWIRDNLSPSLTKSQFDNLLIIGIIILLGLLIFFLYFYRPSLFYLNKKRKTDFLIEDEDMESEDLDEIINKAIRQKQYTEAIRFKYLKILKELTTKQYISFDANKTVNEYVYEIKNVDIRNDFKNISRIFAYYRYGNRESSMEAFESFNELSNQLLKRI